MTHGPVAGEPTAWDRMLWYLGDRPKSFGLALATADRIDALDGLRATAAAMLAEHGVRVTTLDLVAGRSLVEQLEHASRDSRDVIFATGHDPLLLDPRGGDLRPPEIEELNRSRDRLPDLVSVPVVAWLSTASARALARAARDLNDVIVTRYHFETPPAVPGTLFETRGLAPVRAHHRQEAELLDARLAVEAMDTPAWLDLAERRATLAVRAHEYERASSLFDEVERRRAAAGDLRGSALVAAEHAELDLQQGRIAAARAILSDRVLPALEAAGDQRGHALVLGRLADIEELTGDLDEALTLRQRELPVYRQLGEQRLEAVTLGQIADIYFTRGEYERALSLRRTALALYETVDDVRGATITHGRIADIYTARGELDEALRIRREIELPTFERIGDVRERAITMGKIAEASAARGDRANALVMLHEALEVYTKLGDRRSSAVTQARIGRILAEQGQIAEGIKLLGQALATFAMLGDVRAQAVAQSYEAAAQAKTATLAGLDSAVASYQAALSTLQRIGDRVVASEVSHGLETAISARDDLRIALRLHALVGAHGLAPEHCELSWGRVVAGVAQPLPAKSAAVNVGDRIFVRVLNRGSRTVYVHLFDIGVGGRIVSLNEGAVSGIALGPGQAVVVGKHAGQGLVGVSLTWPDGVVKDRPRLEQIFAIASDEPINLTPIRTGQRTTLGRFAGRPSLLDWLLAAHIRDDDPQPATRFLVLGIVFELAPGR